MCKRAVTAPAWYPEVPDDIRSHNCIRHIGLVPRNDWQFRVGNRQRTVPVNSIMTCNEIEGAVQACLRGLGLGLGMFLSYMVPTLSWWY